MVVFMEQMSPSRNMVAECKRSSTDTQAADGLQYKRKVQEPADLDVQTPDPAQWRYNQRLVKRQLLALQDKVDKLNTLQSDSSGVTTGGNQGGPQAE